jgi:hypothetical protein
MPIQAVIFSKSEWTAKDAMKWLKLHGLDPIKKVHKTKNYLRYRIVEPEQFTSYYMYTLPNINSVRFVIGR